MNRILQYLHRECPCFVATQQLDLLHDECKAIEATCEGSIEFIVPGLASYLNGERKVGLFIACELDFAEIGTDLASHTLQQLRAAVRELTAAADRLEGGAA